ncbi:MAG: hypothetical protein Q8O89_05140, partial [Nanoarchaeota archaeon]|nr:hypothetical protein [Nanoarchaeota archaeon]
MAKRFDDLPKRSQKALLRKHRKDQKTLGDLDVEWHEQNRPAYGLIKKVFGLSDSEFSQYHTLAEEFNICASFMQLNLARSVFRADKLKTENLEQLLVRFNHIEQTSRELEKNKAFQLISEGYDNVVYQREFDALNLPDADDIDYEKDIGPNKISVELAFDEYTGKVVSEFHNIRFGSKLDVYRCFVNDLKSVIDEIGSDIAKLFVDDLAKEARLNYPFDEMPIFLRKFKDDITSFDITSEYFIESLAFMNVTKQNYALISKNRASKKIFDLLKSVEHEEQHRGRLITEYSGKLINLFEEKNSNLVTDLIMSIPSEQRTDLLALIMSNTDVIDFFKSVKKYQVAPGAYAKFLLNFLDHEIEIDGDNKTCLEFVSDVVNINPGTAVTHLIDSTAECILAGNTSFVYDVATKSKLAPVILKDYLEYSTDGNELKKNALITIYYENDTAFDMNYIRKKLKSASNGTLSAIEINARNLHKLSDGKKELSLPRIKKPEKTLLDLILRNVDEGDKEKVSEAYSFLRLEFLENKLKQVYDRERTSLSAFCNYVIGLGQKKKGLELLRVLLK